MSLYQTDYATGKKTLPNGQGREVLHARVDFAVSATMVDNLNATHANFSANDVIEFGRLPAGHVLVDLKMVCDKIDSNGSPAVVLSAGILNAGKTALSTDANGDGTNLSGTFLSAVTTGQAGGNASPAATLTAAWRLRPLESDRSIGVVVGTIPATLQAGTMSLLISYRAGLYNT